MLCDFTWVFVGKSPPVSVCYMDVVPFIRLKMDKTI